MDDRQQEIEAQAEATAEMVERPAVRPVSDELMPVMFSRSEVLLWSIAGLAVLRPRRCMAVVDTRTADRDS